MSRKIISIICCIALFVTAFCGVLPVNAAELPEGVVYDYAFYDFNEGEVIAHTVNTGASLDSNGNTFYPFLSKDSTASLSQENITVIDGGEEKTVSALKVEASAYSSLILTDKNGKPFEARQGVTYTVNAKVYVKYFGRWSQWFYGFGYTGHETSGYKTTNESLTYVDVRNGNNFIEGKAQYAKFRCSSAYYNGVADRYYDTFDTSVFGNYYSSTYTFTIENSDPSTNAFIAHDKEGNEYNINNYFGIFLSMAQVTLADSSKVKSTVYVDSIEIIANDSACKLTTYDGDTLLDEAYVAYGSSLPAAPEKENAVFAGWFLDKEYTIPYTEATVNNYNLTLYALYEDANTRYNVTYYNGDDIVKTEQLKAGAKLWDGRGVDDCYFAGWYTDKNLTKPYSSLYSGRGDTVLYGKFLPYINNITINEFKLNSKVNVYYTYGDEISNKFDAGGWNYSAVVENKLVMKNTRTWAQSGAYIFHDANSADMIVPEPGSTYQVTMKYTVDSVDATSATVYLGYGMKKEYSADLRNVSLVSKKLVATHTVADVGSDECSVTATIVIPEGNDDSVLPCFGVFTTFGGRSDAANETPLTQLTVTEVTIERKNLDDIIGFEGAAVLTDEAAKTAGKQAMRVYFGYTLNENGKTVIDGEEKEVVARGILLKNSANPAGLDVTASGKDGVINIFNNQNMDNCWSFNEETGRVTFSAYINGLNENDEREISMRGYIVTSDGNVYLSKTRKRSVKQITDININTLPENNTKKEKITIMLVIGQSNAEGAGYTEEKGVVEAANGMWELSAMPTTAPYGEVFMSTNKNGVTLIGPENEYSTNYINVKGGFAPAYAAKWNELTGEKVVILQLALGATKLAEWQKDANVKGLYKELNFTQYSSANPSGNRGYNATDGYYLYSRAVTAYNNTYDALSKQYEISHAFYVWNQGESNEAATANDSTIYGDALYEEYFEKMHEDLLSDCNGMTMGTIIAVRSCKASSHSLGGNPISGASTGPRRAQYRISARRDDVQTVSWYTETCNTYASFWNKLPTEKQYGKDYDLVPSYKGCSYAYSNMHYTQLRYNEMGADAAVNLYKSLYGEMNFDGVAVRNANYQLIGKFAPDGSGSFKITNDGTIGTRYLQIRPEDASCNYDFSLHINKETMTLTIDLYTDGSHHASGDEYISEYGEINWSALGGNTLNIVCNVH